MLVLEGLKLAVIGVANTVHQEKCVHDVEREKSYVERWENNMYSIKNKNTIFVCFC